MNPESPSSRLWRNLTIAALLIPLLSVIVWQQKRIRTLEAGTGQNAAGPPGVQSGAKNRGDAGDAPADSRTPRKREDPLAKARQDHVRSVEKQLAEISAPLNEDMKSTMFHTEIPAGRSIVTGGYQTSDGRHQFTILKPRVVRTASGREQIELDSNLIAMSAEDTGRSGLDTLATRARNTLQHAESWEESDVSSTMEILRESAGSENLGAPKVVLEPGQDFTIQMTSDDRSSYTLSGTATLAADGSGVVLKARIEQKEKTE